MDLTYAGTVTLSMTLSNRQEILLVYFAMLSTEYIIGLYFRIELTEKPYSIAA